MKSVQVWQDEIGRFQANANNGDVKAFHFKHQTLDYQRKHRLHQHQLIWSAEFLNLSQLRWAHVMCNPFIMLKSKTWDWNRSSGSQSSDIRWDGRWDWRSNSLCWYLWIVHKSWDCESGQWCFSRRQTPIPPEETGIRIRVTCGRVEHKKNAAGGSKTLGVGAHLQSTSTTFTSFSKIASSTAQGRIAVDQSREEKTPRGCVSACSTSNLGILTVTVSEGANQNRLWNRSYRERIESVGVQQSRAWQFI